MSLLNLSPELLLLVASYVRQVDLLNVSLVCKQLHFTIEPELYREYSNPRLYTRSILPFIKKIIERPELAKHVRQVDLHEWESFDHFYPHMHNGRSELDIDRYRKEELTREEYYTLAETAKCAGVINAIDTYESSSLLLDKVESMSKDIAVHNSPSRYEHLFGNEVHFNDMPYDTKFCQLLRTGIEDAQVVLLLAMLPNLHEVFLRGGPHDVKSLEWRASHKFASLRKLTVCGETGDLAWPLGFYSFLLNTTPRLEQLRVCFGSSWYRNFGDSFPEPSSVVPLTLPPGSLSQLTTLQLKSCCLKINDLQTLIQACPELKSFYYYSGEDAQGPYGPSPAGMIRILEPLKDSLEELWLNLDTLDADLDDDFRIRSLTHFTALKTLDTSADMWEMVEDLDVLDPYRDEDTIEDSYRLCYRLPKNLQQLIFHLSAEQAEPSIGQIVDLVQMRHTMLPNLQHLCIATEDEEFHEELDESLSEDLNDMTAEPQPFEMTFDDDILVTVFDTVLPSRHQPDTRWYGNKYSVRYRKPTKLDRALDKIGEAYEAGYRGETLSDALADEPELAEVLKADHPSAEDPPEYYDTDEEVEMLG
ncbi:hypothetical protein HBI70_095320 [Parastagonospora nodorum]|nr:hypothetical protein HBI70_095320 [Parastagonospora nodorum]